MKHTVSTLQQVQQLLQFGDDVAARLQAYGDLLVKWQARINLVGPDTIPHLWHRHILDSAQLYAHLPIGTGNANPPLRLADLGCGAGFPGLVLAMMGAADVHLVESDSRKCAFLREAARITETGVTIHNCRIEQCEPVQAHVVTARALASLGTLLGWATRHLLPEGHCLFLKGRGAEDELTEARKEWDIKVQRIPSLTEPNALILNVSEVRRG